MTEAKENQTLPESQKEPFGPKQLAWINEHYGKAFHRDAEPMVRGKHD